MSDKAKQMQQGSGPYTITRKGAGEAWRAARAYKLRGEPPAWRRPKGKASK